MNLAEVHELADAVLLVWYAGEEGGTSLADIVFGNVSPSGRLPITFPRSLDQLPPYDDYSMKGRTYKYMEHEPMYPFGFGLSYGKFDYSDLRISKSAIKRGESVDVEVTVKNVGEVEADEVVQLYLTKTGYGPLFDLKGVRRVSLKPGASTVVKFTISPAMMEIVNDRGERVIERGEFTVSLGGSLPGTRSVTLGATPAASSTFVLK